MSDTIQPVWKTVANLGDASPIEHGGYFVDVDTTDVYPPEVEVLLPPPDDDDNGSWTVYRFVLEPCTFVDGVLSDNSFHPECPAWFADDLSGVCSYMDVARDDLIDMFTSDDPIERAHAWRNVGEYHGWNNLDDYPLTLNREEVEKRYPDYA